MKPQGIDRVLIHGPRQIPYRLHRGKRRGLRISVAPDLIVNVFAPSRAPVAWIEDAIRQRASWIARTLEKVAACEILAIPDRFTDGSLIRYLGRQYALAIKDGRRANPEILFDRIIVSVPDPSDEGAVARVISKWYRERAMEIFDQSIRRCLPIAARHGVDEPTVTIRNMRSRWGSCSATGRVTLNVKLVMIPEPLVDYVVMHELCHRVHHNHGKGYYALLTKCMPDWKTRKKAIDRYRLK